VVRKHIRILFLTLLCAASSAFAAALTVTSVSPLPNATLTAPPNSITFTLNQAVDPATVNANTVRIFAAGPDGIFGTDDDVTLVPAGISASGNTITVDLTGVQMPNAIYQIAVLANGKSAMQFDGVANLVQIPFFGQVAPTTEVTIEFWQNVAAVKDQSTFSFQPDASGNRCQAYVPHGEGDVFWDFGDDNTTGRLSYTPPVSITGTWQHFALVSSQSGNFMKIYRNGVLEASKTGASTYVPGSNDLRLGYGFVNGDSFFGGQLDEFRVWNTVRSQSQIVANMHAQLSGNEPGLVGYWPFDESGQTVIDHSPSARNGTLGIDANVGADDPTRVTSTAPIFGVTDINGNPLDGKFSGAFPSGNGTFANFVATFTLARPTIQVTALTPAPNSVLAAAPASIVATLNKNVDPATVNSGSVQLVGAGPDGIFGTADDVAITPAGVSANANTITLDLTGVKMPKDKYQVTLSSAPLVSPIAGLSGYWDFNEGSGTAIHDRSGNGNDGTLTGGQWTSGIGGDAVQFAGTNSVVVPRSASLDPTSGVTVTCWANLSSTCTSGAADLVRKVSPWPQSGYFLRWSSFDGLLQFRIDHPPTQSVILQDSQPNSAYLNQWHHYAGTFDSATGVACLYVDGQLHNTATYQAGAVQNSDNLYMMYVNYVSQIPNPGKLDEVRVYNRALSVAEIVKSMQVPAGSITGIDGTQLDGKYPGLSGGFPSGDGTLASFVSTFTVSAPPLLMTGLLPAPNSVLTAAPASIVATLSNTVDPATVNASSVQLVGAGSDGLFGTADDVTITPAGISATGNSITINLTGVTLPYDKYELKLVSTGLPIADLAASFKFDEGSGTSTADSSGNSNTGTLLNGVTWVPGMTGSALKFDGANGRVKVAQSASLEPATGVTVSLWGKIDGTVSGSNADLLRKEAPGQGGYVLRWSWSNGTISWLIVRNNGAFIEARDSQATTAYVGGWHHFVGTYDAASGIAKLYVDGALHGSASGGPSPMEHTDDLYLMYVNYPTEVAVPGTLDDVRVFKRALSATEVQALAGKQTGVSDSNGVLLDGKYPGLSGGFPSGDGTLADFVATFTLAAPPALHVTALSPAPSAELVTAPVSVVATFDNSVDPASVTASTVQLTRAGPDGVSGTSDDVIVVPHSMALNGNTITLDLSGQTLPHDVYQLRLRGSDLQAPARTDYAIGTQPAGIEVGDIDGDGKPDLVVCNVQSNDVSVLLGDGAGHFASAVHFPVGKYCWSVSLADINGDGKLDIAIVNGAYGTGCVLLNTTTAPGTPTFSAPVFFSLGNNPSFVLAKDINGDGKPDLIVANQDSGNFGVLLNTTPAFASTPTFSAMRTFSAQTTVRALAVADINGDGKLDVAVSNYASNSISVFLNTTPDLAAVPTFTPATNYSAGQNPYHVDFADINGDGKPDIIEPNYFSNSIGILLNNTPQNASAPSFAAPVYINVGAHPHYVFAGDLDGDGRVDLISNNHESNTIQVAINQTPHHLGSTPVFATPIQLTSGSSPGAIRIADITGHGGIAAIVANENSGPPSTVSVYTGFTGPVLQNSAGGALDGEYPGTSGGFPSGNGAAGGDFVSTFTVTGPLPLRVTGLSPSPNAVLAAAPASIVATLSNTVDPATVTANSVRIVGAGHDGQFGTADDVTVTPAGISVSGSTVTVDLTGVTLPFDKYQMTLVSGGSVTSTGLAGYWKLDETSGLTAHDSSGNSNDGALQNGPVWSTGVRGGGLSFDGVNAMVVANPSASLEPVNGITVATWANITDTRSNAISELVRKAAPFQSGYLLRWSDTNGIVQFVIDQSGTPLRVNDNIPNSTYLNGWHHFAGTFDASTGVATLYVDGVSHGSSTGAATNLLHTGNLQFMNFVYAGDAATPGTLDEVRIYDHALSPAEISALSKLGITDANGAPLDGKFSGAFPSGDGTMANFVSTFTVAGPPIVVTALTPAPGTLLTTAPASIVATLNKNVDPATVNSGSVQLVGAGPDGIFGTADDVAITPAGVSATGNTITLDLTGVKVPNDKYQLILYSNRNLVNSGLTAWWNLDESTGTKASDSSGLNQTAVWKGSSFMWIPAGKIDGALRFVSDDSYLEAPDNAAAIGTGDFSVAFWINFTDTSSYLHIISNRKSGNHSNFWEITAQQGSCRFEVDQDTSATNYDLTQASIAINNGQWHHVVATRSATQSRLYIDGMLNNSTTAQGVANIQNVSSIILGNNPYIGHPLSDSFHGMLDSIRIYSRELTAAEIRQLDGQPGVTDTSGNPLDGKFSGTFPSGDGTLENFVSTFTVSAPPLRVTALSPAPDTVLTAPPASIVATFSTNVDPASINTGSVQLIGAGPDGLFGTPDDVTIFPAGIIANGNSIKVDLSGVQLPGGNYRVTLAAGKAGPVSGLVGHLAFTEGSGTIAHDSSGHGNDGSLQNGPAWTSGEIDGALQFNGVNQDVQVSSSASLGISGTGLTLAAWIYPTSTSGEASIIHKDFNYSMTLRADRLTYADSQTWSFNSIGTYGHVPANIWSHVAVTFDGTSIHFYINGALVGTTARAGSISANSNPLYIGSYNGTTSYFPGKIDESRVYNRALSAAEIGALTRTGVADSNGNPLDGEYPGQSGGFPSGNGTAGGDFVANFRIDTPPLAVNQSFDVHSYGSLPVPLFASDGDNDPLTYTLVSQPAHGMLSGTPPNLTYTASAYAGQDSFTFKANDGRLDGNVATVSINVFNTPPVAQGQFVTTHSNVPLPLELLAFDADHDLFTYSIVTSPAHGTLTGTLPNLVYRSYGYTGPDSFSFIANDGIADSNIATISISVADQPPQASLTAAPTILIEGQSVAFSSGASDPDNDALTYLWDFGDGASSTDANPVHIYSTAGTYMPTVTVTDVAGLSATQSIPVFVYHDSDRPTARFVTSDLNGFVGQPVGFDATFSTDPNNRIVSYLWDFGDGSPQGEGQLISRAYTATGTYTVTLTIADARGLGDTTSVTMIVLPAVQAGLFTSNIKYSVKWNRSTPNADTLNLTALVNVGSMPVTSSTTMSVGVVGQTFSTSPASKLSTGKNSGPQVKFQAKPVTKNGAIKGTVEVKGAVRHASFGLAFALAGVTGTNTATHSIPIRLVVGKSAFESLINSQFRFGSNGAKASGGGQGPK
jgi:PKD repeat protein